MVKKKIKRKHVPQRTCVGCREVHAKRNLIRIVKTPSGVFIDPSGKMHGRGAYLHDQLSCWQRGIKGPLSLALKAELTDEDRNRISIYMNSQFEEKKIDQTCEDVGRNAIEDQN